MTEASDVKAAAEMILVAHEHGKQALPHEALVVARAYLALTAEAAGLRERVAKLEAGIRPFAEWARQSGLYEAKGGDAPDDSLLGTDYYTPRVGQLRTLAALLTEEP